MVNVTHHTDHRRTLGLFLALKGEFAKNFFLKRIFTHRIGFVTKLLSHQHSGFLIESLVDRRHYPHAHQFLDDVR